MSIVELIQIGAKFWLLWCAVLMLIVMGIAESYGEKMCRVKRAKRALRSLRQEVRHEII